VLVEQTGVVDAQRLGSSAGRLDGDDLRAIDETLTRSSSAWAEPDVPTWAAPE
jgi:mRNA-degrading endonuclease toxin of MazEF toxin-antitoxin module